MSAVNNGASQGGEYRRIKIERVLSSRYSSQVRPNSWDNRTAGVDLVAIEGGETLKLNSSAMQSPPKPGWVLMLTGGNVDQGFTWTLYGMPRR